MSGTTRRKRAKKGAILYVLLLALMLFQTGDMERASGRSVGTSLPGRPAARPCCLLAYQPVFPWALFPWVDPLFDTSERLDHRYGAGIWSYVRRTEINGLVYTCSVGIIDLGHVRHVADLTYYYYGWLRQATEPGTSLQTVGHDGLIKLTRSLPADDLNLRLQIAQNLAYDESIFYEIETYWSKLLGQHHSAFSPEDLVSNLLGTYVAGQAVEYMQLKAVGFDIAVSQVLAATLARLGALSVAQTKAALVALEDGWFLNSPHSLDYLQRRNFAHDPVRPWRLEGVAGCADPIPFLEAVRSLPRESTNFYTVKYKMPRILTNPVLRYLFEVPRGFRGSADHEDVRYIDRRDFANHIARIKVHARTTYGPHFDKPLLRARH
jgi:hypothetical protein